MRKEGVRKGRGREEGEGREEEEEEEAMKITIISAGVGTLEISGGIYNTAGFFQRDSWRKDTNIITSKTQALGIIVWRSHTHFIEGVATPDYNIIRVGGERSFLFNSQCLRFAVYNGRHCIIIDI